MKKISLALLFAMMSFAGLGHAQTDSPSTEIRESTDPSKIAEVERRAQELIERGHTTNRWSTSGASGSEGTSASGTTEKSDMRSSGKKQDSKSSRKSESSGASGGMSSSQSSSGSTNSTAPAGSQEQLEKPTGSR